MIHGDSCGCGAWSSTASCTGSGVSAGASVGIGSFQRSEP